ncbi:MAG TPA: oxygenase MpaB family protein [Acidimicrobiales bacterium]
MLSGLALAPAGANVIMQLSRLPVGHAVARSKAPSGSLSKHPVKRTRTTLGYIMIALFGSEREREVLRAEVNAQHRLVRSSEGDAVTYDAFDPDLQLWVAACMYQGSLSAIGFLRGSPDDEERDLLLTRCARFATTLQVPAAMWPGDRAAFDRYWNTAVQHIGVDDVTREFLLGIASLSFLPRPLARVLGPPHLFLTSGFLPEPFRKELGLKWTPRQQAKFERCTHALGAVNRHVPRSLREFPWNVVEFDTRRRIRRGRSIL